MTTVRMNVATSESTPATPIFPKIAVSAADTADSIAQNVHEPTSPAVIEFLLGPTAARVGRGGLVAVTIRR